MLNRKHYHIIGLMSGTSLDGVDLAYCTFTRIKKRWRYAILRAETVGYNKAWRKRLVTAHQLPGDKLVQVHIRYGHYLGSLVNRFCRKYAIEKVDFIASHGHTVYHQPGNGFTFQLGDGNAIHAVTNKKVVFDFRSLDVARGGQGAPLVPVGDHLLFNEYDVCLNLGGIANCSMIHHNKRIAFDICYVNMALNYLAEQAGKWYDKQGAMAAAGKVDRILLKKLTAGYATMRKTRPSLGREFFEDKIVPVIQQADLSVSDKLATAVESIAIEINHALTGKKRPTVLCTGGGALNSYLMYRLLDRAEDRITFIIPDESVVKFKEALVFGLLGVLRVRSEINCLKSVTGAATDSSSGLLAGF
ncbi:MAG: anhydro-N-acetylmuramic acid kinase [Flammeovirgaceae bacterium]|nr:MAG: anhydro-N-acetylmuramic acid kinase [Flammeovirgaceae bacterium]